MHYIPTLLLNKTNMPHGLVVHEAWQHNLMKNY